MGLVCLAATLPPMPPMPVQSPKGMEQAKSLATVSSAVVVPAVPMKRLVWDCAGTNRALVVWDTTGQRWLTNWYRAVVESAAPGAGWSVRTNLMFGAGSFVFAAANAQENFRVRWAR